MGGPSRPTPARPLNRHRLSNVERPRFSDAHVVLDTDGTPARPTALYRAAFAREPDSGGVGLLDGANGHVRRACPRRRPTLSLPSEFQTHTRSAPSTTFLDQALFQCVGPRASTRRLRLVAGDEQRLAKPACWWSFRNPPANQAAVATDGFTGFAYTEWPQRAAHPMHRSRAARWAWLGRGVAFRVQVVAERRVVCSRTPWAASSPSRIDYYPSHPIIPETAA